MPKIFELFGYPLTDQSPEAQKARQSAHCPFMDQKCDGGGNRELSRLKLTHYPDLQAVLPLHSEPDVSAGICSIQVETGKDPWIVCPRRLLTLGRQPAGTRQYQAEAEKLTLKYLDYPSGTQLGVWPEVKLNVTKIIRNLSGHLQVEELPVDTELTEETIAETLPTDAGIAKKVNYTLDYVLVPLGRPTSTDILRLFAPKTSWKQATRTLTKSGYVVGRDFVDAFPVGVPSVIEIMTSSTSGGNKKKRSTIPCAFEDAMLGREHQAPGINYRQVWARMISQLVVKSEFAIGWGGRTIWILQDKLLNYIGSTTALMLNQFVAEHPSEVNMLAFTYPDTYQSPQGVIDLTKAQLYAGPISHLSQDTSREHTIQDIIRAPFIPTKEDLLKQLRNRAPINYITVP